MTSHHTLRVAGVPAETMVQLDQLRAMERATNVELLVSMIAHRHELVFEQVRREGEQ